MEFRRIQNAIELFGSARPDGWPKEGSAAQEAAAQGVTAQDRARPEAVELNETSGTHAAQLHPANGNGAGTLHGAGAIGAGVGPKLDIGWRGYRTGFWSSLGALFGPVAAEGEGRSAFRDSWVEGRVPRRAVVAAALWHLAFLAMPFSLLTGVPHTNPAFKNLEIAWRGPIEDLPLLEIAREKPKPVESMKKAEPTPTPVIEAFHPRQRIFTDPVRPNHPRQTLINPKAPNETPKLLANLPNMVQLQQIAGPAKPRLQIDEEMLKKLRPKEKQAATTAVAAPVDMPNMEQQVADMSLPAAQNGPARPKLQLNAGAAPRVAERARGGDAGPAPEITAAQSGATGSPSTLIALSANPAPPAPVQPPAGNLAAKIAVSPEGKPGAEAENPPGAAADAAGAKNSVGISISGGNPAPKPDAARVAAPPRKLVMRPEPKGESEDAAERTGPPDFASLPPGAKPEVVFASKRVYTLNVNMPNLNSATGSWVLNFSELNGDSGRRHIASSGPELSGPVPLTKIDPKYPPTLIAERVAGEVILYAVIRRDGSVDSIQVVRGVDQQLDKNAMSALSQWKFQPGAKQGTPIELEAIVHIPFRLPEY